MSGCEIDEEGKKQSKAPEKVGRFAGKIPFPSALVPPPLLLIHIDAQCCYISNGSYLQQE